MSTKRQPSKQRRQTQNQKQRAAREARTSAAAASAASPGASSDTPISTEPPSGSVLSRFRGARSTGRAIRAEGAGPPVGHRAALSALLAAVAAAVVGSFLFKVPVDRVGEPITSETALVAEWSITAQEALADDPEATPDELAASIDDWSPGGSEPYIQAFFPMSLTVFLPVIGTGLGYRAVSKRSSAKVVNRTMYVTLFGALLASQLLIVFLPAVISLAVAAFQVRKAEVRAAEEAAPADGVIDVDAVEEDELLDEADAIENADVVEADIVEADVVEETDEVDERP